MLTVNTAIENALRKLIDTAISGREQSIALGQAVDYASYKQQCGMIAGLRAALDLLDEAVEIVEKYQS